MLHKTTIPFTFIRLLLLSLVVGVDDGDGGGGGVVVIIIIFCYCALVQLHAYTINCNLVRAGARSLAICMERGSIEEVRPLNIMSVANVKIFIIIFNLINS